MNLRHRLLRTGWAMLPGRCLLCGLPSLQLRDLCRVCETDMRPPGASCNRCGAPTLQQRRCEACAVWLPPWQSLQAACSYREPADLLVTLLKFRRQRAAARVMAELMHQRLPPEHWGTLAAPLLVPVPLHRWRQWRRGFNQCELIGAHLAHLSGLPLLRRGLRRTLSTRAQARLTAQHRHNNLTGAFQGHSATLRGADCILLDDVLTTGATLAAASQAALLAGANSVHGWIFARTPAPGD